MKNIKYKLKISRRSRGMYLPLVLLSAVIFIAMATAIINIALANVKMANLHNKKITSMSIAEAGVNYYLWHLAHDNTDYCDGNTPCTGTSEHGPYHHEYRDQSGKSIGTYDLYIKPPSPGNSNVIVKSVGKVNGISPTKTIVTEIGMPSFTKYTLLIDSNPVTLGSGGKIDGTVHVNHEKLVNEGWITGDASSTEPDNGVSGGGRFDGQKLFPVPPIDFAHLSVDFQHIRNDAKNNGEGDWYDVSAGYGYHVVLKDSSYDLYRVTKYDNTSHEIVLQTFLGNHNYSEAGVIFCEDNVWVEGKVNDQKVTIVADDPEEHSKSKMKRIYIPNSIQYTNFDGRDKIGLISQTSILLTKTVPATMTLDAAMIASGQNPLDGDVKIENFGEKKTMLTIYGSIAAKNSFWKYVSGATFVSGFENRDITMDQNNVLNPPPKFPLTGTYAILSWREE